ncbi:hypothetical protein [Streptomyces lonegramiae]|uniref:Secreted protein n=1 Tax=Streptomyces lonegramiae TaxID=3075524 RepID=A0ABU2XXP7_9ACTN|nr:hypothetical protein [Streptomyces sp. DSM 41529]MDT0549835.1 hypothetical protein [Streptomyces sp. DSM 41529]
MPGTALRQRLAELRGPAASPHPLDARALAALAANPGCRRRALLDGAGVDKLALAQALGSPGSFGQSQFAHQRGNTFEARAKTDGGEALLRLLHERLRDGSPEPEPGTTDVPDLAAVGPQGRTARTALALREATAAGRWALLDHPMVSLDIAGSPAFLEPDAVVVHPDGSWTVVEIKSFPMVDGSADPAKVGAAARQAAVYALALERVAARITDVSPEAAESPHAPAPGPARARVRHEVLLVCPKDFSNLPTAELVDVRKQLAVTRRQLTRLTRIDEIAAALPEGLTFDLRLADDGRTVTRPAEELAAAVDAVDAAYAPECLSACELAVHCRARCRVAGGVESLGRGVRGELGGLTTIEAVLAAALGEAAGADSTDRPAASTGDPAVDALRRAAALRAEALGDVPPPAREAACR